MPEVTTSSLLYCFIAGMSSCCVKHENASWTAYKNHLHKSWLGLCGHALLTKHESFQSTGNETKFTDFKAKITKTIDRPPGIGYWQTHCVSKSLGSAGMVGWFRTGVLTCGFSAVVEVADLWVTGPSPSEASLTAMQCKLDDCKDCCPTCQIGRMIVKLYCFSPEI